MKYNIHFFIWFLIVFTKIEVFFGKIISGILQTNENWVFLTRFCFLSENGQLSYEFELPSSLAPIEFLLYYDELYQWNAVYKKGLPCEAVTKEPFIDRDNQVVSLGSSTDLINDWTGCKSDGGVIRCRSERSFRANRERWWFLAVARCSNKTIGGMFLKYNLHMLNGDAPLTKELSADEFYILETDIVFFFTFLILFIMTSVFAFNLKQRMLLHTTYKMFMISMAFMLFSLLISCITYGKLANSGIEDFSLKTFGRILDAISYLTFLLMLLLLGKGYTVTRGRLSQSSTIKIYIFMSLFVIIFITLFFNDAINSDPGLVLYLYESIPGYGLLSLRIIAWFYFTFACSMAVKHYPEKKLFYYPFYAFYTFWFLIGPTFVLIACFAIPKYKREKITNGIDLGISLLAHCYFLYLTRPSNTNKNFPYHVRTSQVGILSACSDPDDNINFVKVTYAPSIFEQTGPDFTNMFNIVKNVYGKENHTTTLDGGQISEPSFNKTER